MTYYNGDKKLSTSAWRDLAYMKTDWKGDAYVKSADKDAYMRQQLSLGVGELIYGLGERFAAFTRNGQSIDIWNEDGGTSTDQSYKKFRFIFQTRDMVCLSTIPRKYHLKWQRKRHKSRIFCAGRESGLFLL